MKTDFFFLFVLSAPGLLFFLGDMQAHIYRSDVTGDNWNHANGIANLDQQVMQEIKQLFPQETDVFWGKKKRKYSKIISAQL